LTELENALPAQAQVEALQPFAALAKLFLNVRLKACWKNSITGRTLAMLKGQQHDPDQW